MTGAAFIGDELTGAGFRLAGMRVHLADPEHPDRQFQQVLSEAGFVILTNEVANRLPPTRLREAVARARPPVAIVPAVGSEERGPDLEREVRVTLGMEA